MEKKWTEMDKLDDAVGVCFYKALSFHHCFPLIYENPPACLVLL